MMHSVNEYDFSHLNSYLSKQDQQANKEADDFTLKILDEICDFIQPGVRESEVLSFAKALFEERGAERIWHQPLVRFADHTCLTFKDRAKEDYTLKTTDIAFVDIGIVVNGIEGDVGKTLYFGDNEYYNEVTDLSRVLFEQARAFWRKNQVTGVELYDFIYLETKKHGYEFNLQPAGHLIGSFSHAVAKWRDGLNKYPGIVQPYQWILEIQIKHPELEIGGFYEQLLY